MPPGDEERPGFNYTAGLTEFGHSELVVYDVPDEMGQWLLNDLADRIIDGETFTERDAVPRLLQGDCEPRLWTVTRFKDSLGVAFELYGEGNVTARRLVLPDRENRFPWEPGYDGPDGQALLFAPPPASSG